MNIDVLEVFDGVKNVEFKELAHYEDENAELLVFALAEPTADEWNAKARKQNTKMFTEITGKSPTDYDEVLSWIYCSIEKDQSAENTMAFVG